MARSFSSNFYESIKDVACPTSVYLGDVLAAVMNVVRHVNASRADCQIIRTTTGGAVKVPLSAATAIVQINLSQRSN